MRHRRSPRSARAQTALGAAVGLGADALRRVSLPAPQPYLVAVSHRHRLLFYSIPKVASATLRWLMLMLDAEDPARLPPPEPGAGGALGRLQANGALLQAFTVPISRCRRYRRFCFVRNPWDRLVSAFSDKVVRSLRLGRRVAFVSDWPQVDFSRLSFEEFATLAAGARGCRGNFHIRPQNCFIGARRMDFIGRFENFEGDVDALFARFELPPELRSHLPKINVSQRRDYAAYYNSHTQELIRRRYADDIARFGYEFGN